MQLSCRMNTQQHACDVSQVLLSATVADDTNAPFYLLYRSSALCCSVVVFSVNK
jgi:hypothetical protein